MRSVGVIRPVGWVIGAVAVGATLLVATADPAEAGRRRWKRSANHYSPPTASMVVDAKTGKILHAANADASRIPASITKVMTLYMLFEQLERGRYTLNSELRVSARAASQEPSKLGLRPGDTIAVEDAIKAMVTKSANDVAVTVGENISGSEDAFADAMTRKAHALGMSRTTFHNAHGLPHNPPNLTTARDLIILGRAIQDRFPKYYQYFATRSFEYDGARYGNHNRLLGRVEGVDGIKTGYTRASGFNLLTSAKTDGRHIVAVVLGGRSGRSRDAQMANLVGGTIERAYAGARSAPTVGETSIASSDRSEQIKVASAEPAPRPEPSRPEPVRAEPLEPRPAPTTTASIAPPRPIARPLELSNVRPVVASAVAPMTTTPPSPPTRPVGMAPIPQPRPVAVAALAPIPQLKAEPSPRAVTAYAPVRPGSTEALRPPGEIRQPAAVAQAARQALAIAPARPPIPAPATTAVPKQSPAAGNGWVIQLGATDNQDKAYEMLAKAKSKSRSTLAKASPFTERISKDGATLWRARFAGFDSDEAQAACKALKRDGFNCFAARG